MQDIREYLKKQKLLFDGGMGTYYMSLHRETERTCEAANVENPESVREIHLAYMRAGSRAIKTNTFASNPLAYEGDYQRLENVLRGGCSIARQSIADFREESGEDVYLFASMGPMRGAGDEATVTGYRRMVDIFLDEQIDNFLFETLDRADAVIEIAEYIRSRKPDAYIMMSFAILPDGYTREGMYIQDLVDQVNQAGCADAVGMNCVSSALHLAAVLEKLDTGDLTFSVMPNAGYPKIVNNRAYYDSDPEYFADQIMNMIEAGVSIAGGCCGTEPRFIEAVRRRMEQSGESLPKVRVRGQRRAQAAESDEDRDNSFWQKLNAGKKVVAVELDPPVHTRGAKFMSGAWAVKEAGADIITIADCPTARVRMDSSILACKLHRELGMDVLPHMTCRDRNTNATKALLLGLSMEGIRNVLVVTGDPIPTAERDEVKSVYQFNSRKLAGFISSLNRNELPEKFRIYGALNVNVRHFDAQLNLAKQKVERGVSCFLTQPVCSPVALENLKRAKEELDAKILGGIIPVVSSRNARFMNSEISGIYIDESVTARFEGKNRDECTELAVETSLEIAEKIAPHCDGYYLITPFNRTDIITRIMEGLK
ncbi:MAG: bifunctional homocysteine S-methyltransferase/methylenetetrahydrofolate reductase [Clostridia bacterium]|nr:bifunctional homocysteine S-methyltransferase/methylenetetrahydrofolate reductase [Clostridia bacterium]